MAKEKKNIGLLARGRKLAKELISLNDTSKQLVDSVAGNDTSKRDDTLDAFMDRIDDTISTDFKKISNTESGDLGSFLWKLMKDTDEGGSQKANSIEDLFEGDLSGMHQQFMTANNSDLIIMEEIELVTSQFNELNEAIYVTRDSIFNSDDHTATISREIKFKGKSDSKEIDDHVATVEAMETEYKTLQKLKDHIGPNTLKFGKYYVYVAPYSHIFDRYNKKINDKDKNFSIAMESIDESFINTVMESGIHDVKSKMTNSEKTEAVKAVNEFIKGIQIDNEGNSIPVLENSAAIGEYINIKKKSKNDKKIKDASKGIVEVSDGVADLKSSSKDKLADDFSDINGVYMRLIDPRKVVPVRVLDMVVGYYYIHERNADRSRSLFSSNFKIDLLRKENKKEDDFIRVLSEKVIKSFNRPFLEDNIQFKENIATALQKCDIYNKDLKFQFIPKEHMVEYKVNVGIDEQGTSMIQGSLFYAKLYLTLLTFNMHTIVNKSVDQRLYYVANSGVDKDVGGAIQRITRDLKARQINHSDLLNYNIMLSKVGAGRDAFIPSGKGDTRAISFDTLAGQTVELYSELMNTLRTGAINNTGVPSVIMEYVNQADYSRSIIMGNLRHLVRCISNQLNFNEFTTEMYQKILVYGGYMKEDDANLLEFKLALPKTMDTVNFTDILNNAKSIEDFVTNISFGENSDMGDLENKAKDIMSKMLMKEYLQMLDWVKLNGFKEEALMLAQQELEREKLKKSGEETQV